MQADDPFSSGRILLVAAHQDDEVIGAGGQLPRARDRIDILHVTNGSPDDNQDYAAARRSETLNAVALAGIPPERCHELGIVDQKTSFQLVALTRQVAAFLYRLRPDIVLTHPYEGGHPDHDSCAFAVHSAIRQFRAPAPVIWEFTSYHMGPQASLETGIFLSGDEGAYPAGLTVEQQRLKRKMFDCFASQSHVLVDFDLEAERFRLAPHYDFTQPPHAGQLYYEQFDWGIKGAGWREHASQAIDELGRELHATHSS